MTRTILALVSGVFCITALLIGAVSDSRVADAAMNGDKEGVRTLVKQAVDVNAAQGDGMTALHWAAKKGDLEVVQMLIYAGANVKAATRLGGYTPLFMAAEGGYATVIDALLKAGADAKVTAVTGITPLMMAAMSGDPDSVKRLLDGGADANARESERGQTALSFAAAFNRPAAIKTLIASGANPNITSKIVQPVPLVQLADGGGAVPAFNAAANAPRGRGHGSVPTKPARRTLWPARLKASAVLACDPPDATEAVLGVPQPEQAVHPRCRHPAVRLGRPSGCRSRLPDPRAIRTFLLRSASW